MLPVTVKSPVTVKLLPIVTSFGNPIWIWLLVTVVSISFDVPVTVRESVLRFTISSPVEPEIVKLEAKLALAVWADPDKSAISVLLASWALPDRVSTTASLWVCADPDNTLTTATLWVWADPDSTVSSDILWECALADSTDTTASLCEWAELLTANEADILACKSSNPSVDCTVTWDEPDTNVGTSSKFAKGIDPDTIWPPLATTARPVVADENVMTAVLTLDVSMSSGIICRSLSSYTCTITFLLLKLCVTVLEVTLVNVSSTVAFWVTVKFVNPEPSPSYPDAVIAPVPKSTSWLSNAVTTWVEPDRISVVSIVIVLSVTATATPPSPANVNESVLRFTISLPVDPEIVKLLARLALAVWAEADNVLTSAFLCVCSDPERSLISDLLAVWADELIDVILASKWVSTEADNVVISAFLWVCSDPDKSLISDLLAVCADPDKSEISFLLAVWAEALPANDAEIFDCKSVNPVVSWTVTCTEPEITLSPVAKRILASEPSAPPTQ